MTEGSEKHIGVQREHTDAAMHDSSADLTPSLYAFAQLSKALLKSITFEDVLEATREVICPTDVSGVAILLCSGLPDNGQMEIAASWEREGQPSLPVGTWFSTNDNLLQSLSSTDQPIVVANLVADERASAYMRSTLLYAEIAALALMPLRSEQSTFGALLIHRSDLKPFDAETIRLYKDVGALASEALHRLWLIQEQENALAKASALFEIAKHLLQAKSPHELLEKVVSAEFFGAARGTIALLEPAASTCSEAGQRLVFRFAVGANADEILGTRTPVTEGIIGWVVRQNEPATIPDACADERCYQQIDHAIYAGTESILCVPLRIGDRVAGAVELIDVRREFLNEEGMRLLSQVANQAALLIENERLLKENRQFSYQSSQALQESSSPRQAARALGQAADLHGRDEWVSFPQSKEEHLIAVTYDRGTVESVRDLFHPLIKEAVSQGRLVAKTSASKRHRTIDAGDAVNNEEESTQSLLGIPPTTSLVTPLMVRGQVIGALGLEDPDQIHEWTTDELSMVQEIADRVALAIENARLLEETQASLAETEHLYRATGRLSRADNAAEIIDIVAQEFRAALSTAFSGSILSTGPDPANNIEWLEERAQWNSTGITSNQNTRYQIADHPLFRSLLGKREPLVIKNPDAFPLDMTPSLALDDIKPHCVLVVPLVAGDSRLGVVNIYSQHKDAPNPRTVRLLQNLADRAAVTLESVRLYAETHRRAIQLEAASKVSRAATSILEQDRLLSSVVELIRDHFNYVNAQVFLLDPIERRAVLKASTGEAGRELVERGHAVDVGGDSLIGYITMSGEPRYIHSAVEAPLQSNDPALSQTCSELAIPLLIGGRVIGALHIQSTTSETFGTDDIAVLSTLADQLAIAIENARLYQKQLETAAQLREMDRLKTQFLANMSHELRTPLNSIIGFSRVILKGIDGPLTDLQKQDLTAIYNSGTLLLRLINDVLDISKIAAGKMDLAFEEVNLNEVIQGVMSTTKALVKEKSEIELRQNVPSDLPLIVADATRLRQVLLNLLSNAAKFTEKGYIELSASHTSRFVTIQVADTGIGIPADKFELVFQEFEQVDGSTTRAAGGTGLGLPISRHFVEMHGGRMWVESEVGVGSTFFVELPIKGPHLDEQAEKD